MASLILDSMIFDKVGIGTIRLRRIGNHSSLFLYKEFLALIHKLLRAKLLGEVITERLSPRVIVRENNLWIYFSKLSHEHTHQLYAWLQE